jgi:hypothetical protein
MYADIHCHPGTAAYDRMRMADHGKDKTPSDPWGIPQSDLVKQALGKRTIRYSQCDLAKNTAAGVKLLFAALYPIEKKYFSGVEGGRIGKKMVTEFYRRVFTDGESPAMDWFIGHMRSEPGMERFEKFSFDFLHNRPMTFSPERIQYLQNDEYDYFEELKREYKFYRTKAGLPGTTLEELQLYPNGTKKNWSGVYHLATNGEDFRAKFNPDDDDVMMVLTIEGIHALGVGNPEDEIMRDGQIRKDVGVGELKSRIRQLKGEEQLEDSDLPRWDHRPFFMTFAHHFNNTLCGHARSLPPLAKVIYDQRKNMDKGVLRQATYEVMHELLGLDDRLKPTGSSRIHIDVTHMSAASRKNYYDQIIRPFNRNVDNRQTKIPVIASHVGYSGIHWLEDQVKNAYRETEDSNFQVNGFFGCGINLSDEDVVEIHTSRGLLGISFDRQLLGNGGNQWFRNIPLLASQRRRALRVFYRTIKEFVNIPFYYHLEEPLRIWDVLCLGTGFEGFGETMTRYATVLEFRTFEIDLIEILERLKKEEPLWFGCYKPEQLARKICFSNAVEFVKTHY